MEGTIINNILSVPFLPQEEYMIRVGMTAALDNVFSGYGC